MQKVYIVAETMNGCDCNLEDNIHTHIFLSKNNAKKCFNDCVNRLKNRDNDYEDEKENNFYCEFMNAEYEVSLFKRDLEDGNFEVK